MSNLTSATPIKSHHSHHQTSSRHPLPPPITPPPSTTPASSPFGFHTKDFVFEFPKAPALAPFNAIPIFLISKSNKPKTTTTTKKPKIKVGQPVSHVKNEVFLTNGDTSDELVKIPTSHPPPPPLKTLNRNNTSQQQQQLNHQHKQQHIKPKAINNSSMN